MGRNFVVKQNAILIKTDFLDRDPSIRYSIYKNANGMVTCETKSTSFIIASCMADYISLPRILLEDTIYTNEMNARRED